jgi:hypothetical protein
MGYAATVVSHHGTAAALAAFALASVVEGTASAWAGALLAGVVALRLASAAAAHKLIASSDADLASFALLPIRDLVATGLFLAAWTGNTVTWRGRRFVVLADGTLKSTTGSSELLEAEQGIRLPVLTAGIAGIASGGS